ncbi:hypothetical protein [uncultured Methanobrevibacter sp.]|uniref:hypothetical protein n=1 Tax=uncultured Methanobrevibacter sp. TaxID=253161 RepID=UPI0025F73A69|nr:hypothetical protein [uncultured Methanobrevibacter sp.]
MSSTILKPVPQYENYNILKETLFIEDILNGELNKEVIKTYLLTFTNGIKVIFKLEYIVLDIEKIMVNHVITHQYNYFNKFSDIVINIIINEICENKYFRYQIMCLEIGDNLKCENFSINCIY